MEPAPLRPLRRRRHLCRRQRRLRLCRRSRQDSNLIGFRSSFNFGLKVGHIRLRA